IHYSDQRIRMMVEAVQDYAIIMLDPDGYVVSWNSGAARIKGYQAKEIIGKHFSCFYPPEDIEHGKPEHGLKVASSEGRFEYEGWRLRKDGSRFWANVIITPVRDDRGQLIAYSKVTHDLTERKRAQEALDARYRELQILHQIGQTVLTSPDLKTALEKILDEAIAVDSFDLGTILLVDPSGEKIEAAVSRGYRDPANIARRPSEEATQWARYRAGWYRNTTVVENVATSEGLRTLKREGVQSAVLTPVRAGEKILGILQVGSRTPRQFDADKIKLLDAIGNQMGVAIQKSSLFEEAKRNLERIHALREIDLAITSTLDLQTILHVLLEKIELFIPYPSATTVRLVNRENGQWDVVACRNVDEAEWKRQVVVTPSGRAARVLQTKRPVTVRNIQTDPLTYNPSLYRNHGLISYLGVPLIVKDEAVGVLNLYTKEEHEFSDEEVEFLVTLAGQATVAIQNAQMFAEVQTRETELKRANKIKDEFLGVISHELRTPLNVIMGYTGLLVEGLCGELSAEQNKAAQTVMSQSKDLLTLVNHILQATQIESGNPPVSKTAVNLTRFLDELKTAYDLPTKKQLTIDWDYPLDLPSVETDSGKLKEILQNLISNAIKFTEDGTISITARYRPEAKAVVFKVADTGTGIPKELVPIIFEKFRQVDGSNTRAHDGVGLGLYIVKKYTELLGGEVEVKSEIGKGSTFTVTIPCETAQYSTWQDDQFEQTL
ncbi:MAG: GAF domain-containing protein, partial [Deltaproteobacteria bacterium]|nr:GAF domain-containing protein [Deltaproteobacteria bacterium]